MSKQIGEVWALQPGTAGEEDVRRLYFSKKLEAVTDRIHAAGKIKEIMLDLSPQICDLFSCERLTIYAVGEGGKTIQSVVKTGLNSFRDFTLPISDRSVAGFVAMSKQSVNLTDVYDEAELKSYSPPFQFLQKVDRRTGFRTREMLVAPILHQQTGALLGVLQIINNREGGTFSSLMEQGATALCKTLGVAFAERLQPSLVGSKYYPLVQQGILTAPELEHAGRSARRQGIDPEEVLIQEFRVPLAAIGASLAQFFDVRYEPYREGRAKPEQLLKNFKREFVENCNWMLVEENGIALTVLATDPEQLKGSRVVNNLFPGAHIRYLVTTNREFRQTIDLFFGQRGESWHPAAKINPGDGAADKLIQQVQQAIIEAFSQSVNNIHITLQVAKGTPLSSFREDGTLQSVSGQIAVNFHVDFPT